MKFLCLFLSFFYYLSPAYADELPINPWATQKQTVRINGTEQKKQTVSSQTVETPAWAVERAAAVRRNNARLRREYAEQQKAEAEQRRRQAEAAAEARKQAAAQNDGMLTKISNFFSSDSQTTAPEEKQTEDQSSISEWQQEYDKLMADSPLSSNSLRKLKRGYNNLTDSIGDTVDKTLKDLKN